MQRFIEPDHIGTRWGIAFGAHLRRSSHRHVDRCLVPTVVMAALTEQRPMQVQDVVASGTFQQVVNVLGGVPPVRSGQGEVTFVWFCVRQSHSRSQYQSRTARGLSWNPCGVAYFSTSTWFHRPSLVRKAEIPLSTLRPAPLNTIGAFAFWHHSCAVFISSSEYGLWWRDPSRCHDWRYPLTPMITTAPKFTGFDLPV